MLENASGDAVQDSPQRVLRTLWWEVLFGEAMNVWQYSPVNVDECQ